MSPTPFAVRGRLPVGFGSLRDQATREGYRFLARLEEEWRSGANRFARGGEALIAVFLEDELVAVGGINVDPFLEGGRAGRLRHLYVAPRARRQGIGREIVHTLLREGADSFERVRLRTSSAAAAQFYERLGFVRSDEPDATHEWRALG